MSFKKGLLIFIVLVYFNINAFAQTRIVWETTYYDNDKINIVEYLMEQNLYIFALNRNGVCKNRMVSITNKTNNDMEIKMNYTISIYGLDRNKNWISRNKRIIGQTITLRPHGSITLMAKLEILNHSDLRSAFPDIDAIDTGNILGFELVHFKIIERNYEIR